MGIDPYSALFVANNIGAAFGARDPRSFAASLGNSGSEMIKGIIVQQELEKQRKAKEKAEKGIVGDILGTIGTAVGSAGGPAGSIAGNAIGRTIGTAIEGGDFKTGVLQPVTQQVVGSALGSLGQMAGDKLGSMFGQQESPLSLENRISGEAMRYNPFPGAPAGASANLPESLQPITTQQPQSTFMDRFGANLNGQQQQQMDPMSQVLGQIGQATGAAIASRLFGDANSISASPRLGLGMNEVGFINDQLRGDDQMRLQQAQLAQQGQLGRADIGIAQQNADTASARARTEASVATQPSYEMRDNRIFNSRTGTYQDMAPNPLMATDPNSPSNLLSRQIANSERELGRRLTSSEQIALMGELGANYRSEVGANTQLEGAMLGAETDIYRTDVGAATAAKGIEADKTIAGVRADAVAADQAPTYNESQIIRERAMGMAAQKLTNLYPDAFYYNPDKKGGAGYDIRASAGPEMNRIQDTESLRQVIPGILDGAIPVTHVSPMLLDVSRALFSEQDPGKLARLNAKGGVDADTGKEVRVLDIDAVTQVIFKPDGSTLIRDLISGEDVALIAKEEEKK